MITEFSIFAVELSRLLKPIPASEAGVAGKNAFPFYRVRNGQLANFLIWHFDFTIMHQSPKRKLTLKFGEGE